MPYQTRTGVFRLVTSLALTIAATSSFAADVATAVVPAQRRLPAEVLAFVSCPDAGRAHERFGESALGQLIQDEALADFRAELAKLFEEGVDEARQELGMSLDEVARLFHGEVALAVAQPAGQDLAVISFVEFGDHGETLQALLERTGDKLEEDGNAKSIETIEGTEVTIYQSLEDEEAQKMAYFIKESSFVLSNSVGLIEEVLVRWDGEQSDSFADSEVFTYLMESCEVGDQTEPDLVWYVSPLDLFRAGAAQAEPGQGPVSPAMVMAMLPVLGVDRLKAIGGASYLESEDYDTLSHTLLYVSQPTSGALKVFECRAMDQLPPKWVPEATSYYSSINWDVEGAYRAIESLVDAFSGAGAFAATINQLADQPPGIHIKQDVIDSLTGRIQVIGDTREAESADDQRMLVTIELKDADRMQEVLANLAQLAGNQLRQRDFRGATIYEADIPNPQGGEPQQVGVTIDRGQLWIANGVTLMEELLRDDTAEAPLAESADFRRVAESFPAQTSILGFQRPAAQVRAVYEMLRSGQLAAVIDEIDFTTLPEFDEIREYFTLTGSFAVPDERGAKWVSFSLKRDD